MEIINSTFLHLTRFSFPFVYTFFSKKYKFFFPAAEAVNQDQNTSSRTTELTTATTPGCPTLSPCFSSDDESVHSPNTIVNQDFQLDDLFDWEGQQDLSRY